MPSDIIKIRVRLASGEAEIEADISHIREAIDLIPELMRTLPGTSIADATRGTQQPSAGEVRSDATNVLPTIMVDKGDSLNDIISKLFADPWGKGPRRLSEVREALQSYGLNYPKQSVAVALLRLAKSAKIRRFKSEGGEYVYTAPTSLILPSSEAIHSESSKELESEVNV